MDFFKELLKFFTDKEYTFTSKFFGLLIVVLTVFLINNLLGFSFYYSNNQKITQLKNIEDIKKSCTNARLLKTLEMTENKIINRKDVFDAFLSIFSKDSFDIRTTNISHYQDTVFVSKHDTIKLFYNVDSFLIDKAQTTDYKKFRLIVGDSLNVSVNTSIDTTRHYSQPNKLKQDNKVIKSRSNIWNTISSSYILLLLIIIVLMTPFFQDKFSWSFILGVFSFILIDAGLIWLNQFLFSLIPVILNEPIINYILNFLVNTIFWVVIIKQFAKKNNAN